LLVLRPFRSVLPTVDPTAFVDASAQVIGDVHVGAGEQHLDERRRRGDVNSSAIGARTNVQDLTLVHVMRGHASDRDLAMTSRSGTRR
jgi:carbonic anhydrase/acetyltransferase-like protein (isoleucine patch superfamily)